MHVLGCPKLWSWWIQLAEAVEVSHSDTNADMLPLKMISAASCFPWSHTSFWMIWHDLSLSILNIHRLSTPTRMMCVSLNLKLFIIIYCDADGCHNAYHSTYMIICTCMYIYTYIYVINYNNTDGKIIYIYPLSLDPEKIKVHHFVRAFQGCQVKTWFCTCGDFSMFYYNILWYDITAHSTQIIYHGQNMCTYHVAHTHSSQLNPITAQSFPKRMLDPLQHPSFGPRTVPCNQPSLQRPSYLENRFWTDMSCQACCFSNQILIQLNPPCKGVQTKLCHFWLPSKISEYVVVHVYFAVEEKKRPSFLFGFPGHCLEKFQILQAMRSNLPGFCSRNPQWSKIHLRKHRSISAVAVALLKGWRKCDKTSPQKHKRPNTNNQDQIKNKSNDP